MGLLGRVCNITTIVSIVFANALPAFLGKKVANDVTTFQRLLGLSSDICLLSVIEYLTTPSVSRPSPDGADDPR